MLRRLFCSLPLSLMLLALTACSGGNASQGPNAAAPGAGNKSGPPLYKVVVADKGGEVPVRPAGVAADPIVISECRLVTIDKQDVPSQRTGMVMVFLVKAGDVVKAEQVLAELDDRLAAAELDIKKAKIKAAEADRKASEDTREEAQHRYKVQLALRQKNATPDEEVRAAKLAWDRYISEAASKQEGVTLAKSELKQSEVILEMHKLRSKVPGIVTRTYRNPGEAVKEQDTVLQIQNIDKLRVEALVPRQYAQFLKKGMEVLVEPALPVPPQQTLRGQRHEITAVAVSNDVKTPSVVSASEDGTVWIWDRLTGRVRREYVHPAAVRSVACTPRGAAANLCLTGAADKKARLYDLASDSDQPLRELKGQHQGPITAVAFAPDGKICATGGEDRAIRLWDVETGELRYALPPGHRGAITSLQFTPQGQLVSAGRDNTLRFWVLESDGARLEKTIDRRSGEVTQLGVSPDGKRVLFDPGKVLRILSLPRGLPEAELQNASGNFTNFALFSPAGNLILTAGASEGRVQLWHAPSANHRAHEIRQFVGYERSMPTCAAFAPDGSFVAVGTRDKQVLIWPVPSAKELDQKLTATLTLVEQIAENSSGQVRVWAELANPDGRLLPGGTATLVIYPKE